MLEERKTVKGIETYERKRKRERERKLEVRNWKWSNELTTGLNDKGKDLTRNTTIKTEIYIKAKNGER